MTKLRSLAVCAFATALITTVAGCSATTGDEVAEDGAKVVAKEAVTIGASTDSAHSILRTVSRVEEISNPNGLTLKLYVDGDSAAAMNGRSLWLGVFGEKGAGFVFEIGPSIATVTKVEHLGPHGVRIIGTHDRFDDATRTVTRGHPLTIDIDYGREPDGDVSPIVEYRYSDGRDYESLASREALMLGKVLAVKEAKRDKLTAKVIEASAVALGGETLRVTLGAQPALNGAHLLLTLDAGLVNSEGPEVSTYFAYETFDLDLDVSHVEQVAFVASNRLEIRGTKETANADGAIETRPFRYTVSFSRAANGAPSKSIELAPL